MAWLLLCSFSFLAWFLWSAYSLGINYRRARTIGLPILIQPINPLNPFWVLLYPKLVPVFRLSRVTAYLIQCSYPGWTFDGKYDVHKELGEVFLVVNPGHVQLCVANAAAAESITTRRKDFPKPIKLYRILNVFGRNVDTVEGEDWQRHRRITVPPFNERNNKLVWKESLRQSRDMLQGWLDRGKTGTEDTTQDTKTLALHVITGAGFGKFYSFLSGSQILSPNHNMSYRDALSIVLNNLFLVVLFPNYWSSYSPWLGKLQTAPQAAKELKNYMVEIVERERAFLSKQDPGVPNLVSTLVRASEDENRNFDGHAIRGLTDDEIYGNLFIFTFAGHETTANTLGYCLSLLAVYPEWQTWIIEELDEVLGSRGDVDLEEYEAVFPYLKRSLALMYETLRLYGPVPALPKTTLEPQRLDINGVEYEIPAHTHVQVNSAALQTDPRNWGSDSLLWRPSRWIKRIANGEAFFQPKKGSYVPWAEGPRVCPGRKFSQVEFVAVIANLFLKSGVRPLKRDDETLEAAEKRILATVKDSKAFIALEMRRPKEISLEWYPRDMKEGSK